jgi:ELWxxDGT repeat protein
LVKDIHLGPETSDPNYVTAVDGTVFFAATDGEQGVELWKSDGTAEGTRLVKDIDSGTGSSFPDLLTNVHGTLIFTADDGTNGRELWRSNGAASGTAMAHDINPIPGTSRGSDPSRVTGADGTVFFSAFDPIHGNELWRTNGTARSTSLVRDINIGSNGSNIEELTNLNDRLIFAAGVASTQLWTSDGTTRGTSPFPLKNGSRFVVGLAPRELTNIDGTLFFTLEDAAGIPRLWRSDGTAEGTTQVKPGVAYARVLTDVGGTLFFLAYDGETALWRSDGTSAGTTLVTHIERYADSFVGGLTAVDDALYFGVFSPGYHGYPDTGLQLWKSDGTTQGTSVVKEIDLSNLINVNGTLFFTAEDAASGSELWKSDGTAAGTMLVKDIEPGPAGSAPGELTNVNGTLFFTVHRGDVDGPYELWKSDGTARGTGLVTDIHPDIDFEPDEYVPYPYRFLLTDVNGTLFFRNFDEAHGLELWKSDGTVKHTVMIEDVNAGPPSSDPTPLGNIEGILYFSADDGTRGIELWKTKPRIRKAKPPVVDHLRSR